MEIKVVDFAEELVNRNKHQGSGRNTGEEFRNKYLQDLESDTWWKDSDKKIVLNFAGIYTLSPSWANEVFAYYGRKFTEKKIKERILLANISDVKRKIIYKEIEVGCKKR